MTALENFEESYKIGFETFHKIFNLEKQSLILLIRDIFKDDQNVNNALDDIASVEKIIVDDTPSKISIYAYSTIIIDAFGISYKPEHGFEKRILNFNKYFKLDI